MSATNYLKKFSPNGKSQNQQTNIDDLLNQMQSEQAQSRRDLLAHYTLPELAQLCASNSHPRYGDPELVHWIVAEMTERRPVDDATQIESPNGVQR